MLFQCSCGDGINFASSVTIKWISTNSVVGNAHDVGVSNVWIARVMLIVSVVIAIYVKHVLWKHVVSWDNSKNLAVKAFGMMIIMMLIIIMMMIKK